DPRGGRARDAGELGDLLQCRNWDYLWERSHAVLVHVFALVVKKFEGALSSRGTLMWPNSRVPRSASLLEESTDAAHRFVRDPVHALQRLRPRTRRELGDRDYVRAGTFGEQRPDLYPAA